MRPLLFALAGALAVTTAAARAQSPAPPSAANGAAPGAVQTIEVGALGALDVYNVRGVKLGDVEAVIADDADRRYVVVNLGRELGVRTRQIAVPLGRLALQANRLVVWGLSDEALRALPAYHDGRGFEELDDDETVLIGAVR